MEEDKKNVLKGKVKQTTKIVLKPLIIMLIITTFVLALLAGFLKIILKIKSENNTNNAKNGPGAISKYTDDTSIDEEGKITLDKTAQELWDELEKNRNDILDYLKSPEDLQKLINAEVVTKYLDTRKNPDAPIDWEKINNNLDNKNVQGIIKLKRKLSSGEKNATTMTYVTKSKFQELIDNYNNATSDGARERAKKEALKHFTLEKGSSSKDDISTLDNFLFIGDSRYDSSLFDSEIEQLGKDITNVGETLSTIKEWLDVAKNEGKGKVQREDKDITGSYSGISIQLGVNSVYNNVEKSVSDMESFLKKLKKLHPDTSIFVNSCLGVNSNATAAGYSWNVTTMQNCIDKFNQKISDFCNKTDDLYYIDISDGLMSNGFLKTKYSTDGLHLSTNKGVEIFADNIKKGILNSDEKTGSGTGFWWPIGSEETTTKDGKVFASGGPALGLDNVSRVGRNGAAKWGKVTNPHEGNNIALDVHSGGVVNKYNVIAIANGTVIAKGDDNPENASNIPTEAEKAVNGGMGNFVRIDYGDITVTYMHLYGGSITVKAGDTVTYGQVIGKIGNNGWSEGAHSHTEYWDNEAKAYLDPVDIVDPNNPRSGGSGKSSTSEQGSYVAKIATFTEKQNKMETKVEGDRKHIKETSTDVENYSDPSYKMIAETIDYEQYVSKFTMPFDYLWIMLLYGQDRDFVMDLADLVFNSEFEITVFDNLEIDTNITTEDYTKKTNITTKATVDVKKTVETIDEETGKVKETSIENVASYEDSEKGEFSATYHKVHTVITKTNKTEVALTLANAWCVKYSQEFKYSPLSITSSSGPTTQALADEANGTETTNSGEDPIPAKNKIYQRAKERYSGSEYIINVTIGTSTLEYSTTGRSVTTQNTVQSTKYTSSPPKVKGKTDPNSKEKNFIILLSDNYNARTNILSVDNWVLEALDKNTRTKDLADLTRYLLYILTGREYNGVTSYDFSVFGPNDLSDVKYSTTIGWAWTASFENEAVFDYLYGSNDNYSSLHIDKYISRDKKYFYAYADDNNFDKNRNFGFGVCYYNNGSFQHKDDFRKKGVNITEGKFQKEGAKLDVDIVNEVSIQYWKNIRAMMEQKAKAANVTLKDYQIDVLTDISYQYGPANEADKVIAAYKRYGLKENAIKNSTPAFTQWGTRSTNRLKLFMTGKYITASGKVLDPKAYSGNGGNILEACKEVTDHYIQLNAQYSNQFGGLDTLYYSMDIEKSYQHNRICCATYVAAVLYKAGTFTPEYINKYNYHAPTQIWKMVEDAGWRCVGGSDKINEWQPGDILCTRDETHVMIYAGDGKVWDQNTCAPKTYEGPFTNGNFGGYYALRPKQ